MTNSLFQSRCLLIVMFVLLICLNVFANKSFDNDLNFKSSQLGTNNQYQHLFTEVLLNASMSNKLGFSWNSAADRVFTFRVLDGNGNTSSRIPTITVIRRSDNVQFAVTQTAPGTYRVTLPMDNGIYDITVTGGNVNWTSPPAITATTSTSTSIIIRPTTPTFQVSGILEGVPPNRQPDVTVTVSPNGGPNPDVPRNCPTVVVNNKVRYDCTFIIDTIYQVQPALNGYIFDPSPRRYNAPVTAPIPVSPGTQFNATLATYNISGRVTQGATAAGVDNVTVRLSQNGTQIQTTTTVNGGNYTFTGLTNGSYVVTPAQTGEAFTPSSAQITINGASQAADFQRHNKQPIITSLAPQSPRTANLGAFTLTINGNNFVPNSVVLWNGQSRATTFTNSTQLQAVILASDTQTAGTYPITVFNPAPPSGGIASTAVNYIVTNASVSITIQTNPAGRTFRVDGGAPVTSQQFNWLPGEQHQISIDSPQNESNGTRSVFSGWSDGNTQNPRTIVVGSSPATFTANFTTQHQLIMVSNPINAGTINPSNGNWYNAGQTVQISAAANSGFTFNGWTGMGNGSYSGPNNIQNIAINGPITQTANFSGCTFSLSVGSVNVSASGGSGTFNLITAPICSWAATPSASWITINSGGSGIGSGTIFYTINPNTGAARNATIVAGDQIFTIAQAGALTSAPQATRFDFDGDRRADLSVFRNGIWYINRSQQGFTGVSWGLASDQLAPADFDGDGKTDVSVFRNGNWFYLRSSTANASFVSVQFGSAGDIPVAADYTGDGRADIAVFRPSNGTWYWLDSATGQFSGSQFGVGGDKPQVGDFDGDGRADLAVTRAINGNLFWYWLNSSTGQFQGVQFGSATDLAGAADFDGDHKTDISVFRSSNGTWYRINSSQNNQFFAVQFGQNGDVPVPADYDGDGRADVSVFRQGFWYRLNSGNGQFYGEQFGIITDKPISVPVAP